MSDQRLNSASETSLRSDLIYAVRYYLRGRRGLLLAGGTIVAAALALNWSWLAAIGIAPIILSLVPCAGMCALGLCMMHRKSADTESRDNHSGQPYVAPKVEVLPPESEPVRLLGPRDSDRSTRSNPSLINEEYEIRGRHSSDERDHG